MPITAVTQNPTILSEPKKKNVRKMWLLLNGLIAHMVEHCTSITGVIGAAYTTVQGNCEEELPKKPVGRLSVNCLPSVDWQVTDSLPTANQQVTITNCRPTVFRRTVGRQTADSLPTDGWQSTDSWPTGFLGSSSSQLPSSLIQTCLIKTASCWLGMISRVGCVTCFIRQVELDQKQACLLVVITIVQWPVLFSVYPVPIDWYC